jgi:hypothetical protein
LQILKLVLEIKILVTLVVWSLPLILFRPSWLIFIGFPDPGTLIIFIRLLGAAYFSLAIGYILGYLGLARAESIDNTVTVGIVSNFFACIILLIYGVSGKWANWGKYSKIFMWGSVVATGAITAGLVLSQNLKKVNLSLPLI